MWQRHQGAAQLVGRLSGASSRLHDHLRRLCCRQAGGDPADLGENKHNAPWDLANAGLMILWGKNPAETNIHQMPFVQKAIERGARLIVIDPRARNPRSAPSFSCSRGPDGRRARPRHRAPVIRTTGSITTSLAPTCSAFRSSRPGGLLHADWASEMTDVPCAASNGSRTPSEQCGRRRSAPLRHAAYTNSGQAMRAMIALLPYRNIGKPAPDGSSPTSRATFSTPCGTRWPLSPETPDGVVRVSVSTARLGRDMLAAANPALKMAWVERATRDSESRDAQGARSPPSPGIPGGGGPVHDRHGREADIILPAKTMFEQSDVIGAYWHPYVQFKQKVLEPPGEVSPRAKSMRPGECLGMSAEVIPEFSGASDAEVDPGWRTDSAGSPA